MWWTTWRVQCELISRPDLQLPPQAPRDGVGGVARLERRRHALLGALHRGARRHLRVPLRALERRCQVQQRLWPGRNAPHVMSSKSSHEARVGNAVDDAASGVYECLCLYLGAFLDQ